MKFTAKSDICKTWGNTEDDFYVRKINNDFYLYIVADGMGGYECGEVASSIATSSISSFLEEKAQIINKADTQSIKAILKEAVNFANSEIYNLEKTDEKYKGMGTTVVLVSKVNNEVYYLSVGDSRIYYIDDNFEKIKQITEDDTYVNTLVKTNVINEDEALTHPQRHMLTKAIGVFKDVDFNVSTLRDKDGYLLLCTDGMTNMLSNEQILDVFKNEKFDKIAEALVKKANENGGNDNITVVVVKL